jgi:hypothetical protein
MPEKGKGQKQRTTKKAQYSESTKTPLQIQRQKTNDSTSTNQHQDQQGHRVPEEHAKIEPNSIHQETPHAPPKNNITALRRLISKQGGINQYSNPTPHLKRIKYPKTLDLQINMG